MLSDKRIRLALLAGIVGWIIMGGLVIATDGLTAPVWIVFVVTSWFQIGALFYRRRPTGPLADAQRLFVEGKFDEAAALLESLPDESAQVKTLLGNTYRQLGRLKDSEVVLRKALTSPALKSGKAVAFPLYGLGRTLLASGDFPGAAQTITEALESGGRKVIRADLALALYLSGDESAAVEAAKSIAGMLQIESYRALMVNYLLHHLAEDPQAMDVMRRSSDGLEFWKSEARRFADTDYGKRLAQEIEIMERLLASEG
jgi:tetratricopeptide (TPR) repeat protein